MLPQPLKKKNKKKKEREKRVGFKDEVQLIRDVAGVLYRPGQQLPRGDAPLGEHEELRRGTKRLSAEEIRQWKQHCQEEEAEAVAAAEGLHLEGGEFNCTVCDPFLTQTEKDVCSSRLQLLNPDPSATNLLLEPDSVNFMAMGRAESEEEGSSDVGTSRSPSRKDEVDVDQVSASLVSGCLVEAKQQDLPLRILALVPAQVS